MAASEKDAKTINDLDGEMWTGTVDPKDPFGFSMELNKILNDALIKVGLKNRCDLSGTLQILPSLLDADKYGYDLIVELGGSREKLREAFDSPEAD